METDLAPRSTASVWSAYARLTRPAQMTAAATDVLAGGLLAYALSDPGSAGWLIWLLVASLALYAGGAALNDWCDRRRANPRSAALPLGVLCLGIGIVCAAFVSRPSAIVAAVIAANAVLYNLLARHRPLLGPFCMGACRALNFLLGMSLSLPIMAGWWPLMLFPFLAAAAVTAVKLHRVHGDPGATARGANMLLLGVTCGLFLLAVERKFQVPMALPFIASFAARAWPPFLRAAVQSRPELAGAAAHAGALSLISLNAALAAGFGGLVPGAFVLLLLPLSLALDRRFAAA